MEKAAFSCSYLYLRLVLIGIIAFRIDYFNSICAKHLRPLCEAI